MQNYTNASDVDNIWFIRTNGLLEATTTFFSPFKNATNIMFEAACEINHNCNVDQLSKKAYMARWLAGTSMMAPNTAGRIGSLLRASAAGAALACTGGPDNQTCGFHWYTGGFDGSTGLGQQLSAMEVMRALLVNDTAPPMTLPNVVIRGAPGNLTAPPPANPSETEAARPLHDGAPQPTGMVPGLALLIPLTIFLSLVGTLGL
jgi:mannan endo-1,6-alpha-mannosidase